jgi:N utilization substance protein A
MATKKRYDEDADIEVTIDRETGDYETVRRWLVVPDDELALLGTQFTTEEAAEKDPVAQARRHPRGAGRERRVRPHCRADRQAGHRAEGPRRGARAGGRAYEGRVGELVAGTVKKVTRDNVIVDLGNNAEGLLPRDQLVGRETFRINDRVRAILTEISTEPRGPQLILSRACPEMLIELFKIEVPEIAEEVIQIAAPPGTRARARRSR